jgi:hypothetical protein
MMSNQILKNVIVVHIRNIAYMTTSLRNVGRNKNGREIWITKNQLAVVMKTGSVAKMEYQ